MKRPRTKQTGFSVLEALLIVVVIGVLAVASWAVYQHIKSSATTTGAAGNPNQSSTQQTTTTPPSSSTTVAYLTIQEWGIKLPLSNTIKDAYYIPGAQNHAADGTPLAMWIGLTSLDAAGCDARTANAPGKLIQALGVLMRVSPTDTDHISGGTYAQEYPGVTIGGYYYAYKNETQYRTCASAASLQSIGSAFTTAIQHATATTN